MMADNAFDPKQLNETETAVLAAVRTGGEYYSGWSFEYAVAKAPAEGQEPAAPSADAKPKLWAMAADEQRPLESAPTIRGAFLRALLLGLVPEWPDSTQGLYLGGVRVTGQLNLSYARGRDGGPLPSLSFFQCYLDTAVLASSAHIHRLQFEHCVFAGLQAESINIQGALVLNGSTFVGRYDAINIPWATISGAFMARGLTTAPGNETFSIAMHQSEVRGVCIMSEMGGLDSAKPAYSKLRIWEAKFLGGVDFSNSMIHTLDARRVHVAQNLVLVDCQIKSDVNLEGAQLLGDLRGDRMRFEEKASGLVLIDARVARACLTRHVVIRGGIRMMSAYLEGGWELAGSTITPSRDGWAIAAREARFSGSVWMRADDGEPFKVSGGMSFRRTKIEGDLDLTGAQIATVTEQSYTDKKANHASLYAPGAEVAGNVLLGASSEATRSEFAGTVVLDGAEIKGNLDLTGGCFRPVGAYADPADHVSISLCDANIGGHLRACGFGDGQTQGVVDLTGASARALDDAGGEGWGEPAKSKRERESALRLRLNGFRYQRIETPVGLKGPVWKHRRKWLERQFGARIKKGDFHPQPYDELARVLRADGQVQDARKISVLKRVTRRRAGEASLPDWLINLTYQYTFDYGFSPLRAVFTLLTYWALGTLALIAAHNAGATQDLVSNGCDAFSPGLQALRLIVPLPNVIGSTTCGIAETAQAWKVGEVAYSVIGALLLALAVLTFSGVMRNEQRQ